jgi:hypothetical protein
VSAIEDLKAAIAGMKATMIDVSMAIGAQVERADETIQLHAMTTEGSSRDEVAQLGALLAEFKQKLEEAHDIADRYAELCDQFSASL